MGIRCRCLGSCSQLDPQLCMSCSIEDCENIQFTSTLLRDGDSFLLGYGVEDCDSFVARFAVNDVLDSLVNVSDEV